MPAQRDQGAVSQRLSKRPTLEIDRQVLERLGDRDVSVFEQCAFPRLGGRVIDLEDAEPGQCIPIRERVETGAEHHVLTGAAGVHSREAIFGDPGAHGHERAQGPADAIRRVLRSRYEERCQRRARGSDGQWVVEYPRRVQRLVCGPPDGNRQAVRLGC